VCKLVYFVSKKIQMIDLQWELLFHILIMSQLICHFPWNQHFSCTVEPDEIQAIQLDMNHIQVTPTTIPSPPPAYVLDSRVSLQHTHFVHQPHLCYTPVAVAGGVSFTYVSIIYICIYK